MIILFKRILLLVVAFLSLLLGARSEVSISIPDSTLERGMIYKVSATGTINENNINDIKIYVRYNSKVLNISTVTGGNSSALKCDTPTVNIDYTNLDSTIAEISCNNMQNILNGNIFTMNIEALAGWELKSELTITKVIVNGIEVSNAIIKNGILSVIGNQIYPKQTEGLGQNYPNPLQTSTKLPIYIEKRSRVNFKIFSTDGTTVVTRQNNPYMFKLVSNVNGILKPIDTNEDVLEPGPYLLEFIPDINEFSCGPYYLLMTTDKGAYNQNILYLK